MSLTREKAKVKKGNDLISYSLNPSWLFADWSSSGFNLVNFEEFTGLGFDLLT